MRRVREEASVVNPGALVSGMKSSEPLGAARRIRDFIEGFRAVCGAGVDLLPGNDFKMNT